MTNSRDPRLGDPLDPANPISGARATPSAAISPTEPGAVDSAGRTGAIEDTASLGGVSGSGGVEPTDPVAKASTLDEIAQAVAAGGIDTGEARARLIEAVIAAHLPPGVDPATEAAIRSEVEELLEGDPTLTALLRPSTG